MVVMITSEEYKELVIKANKYDELKEYVGEVSVADDLLKKILGGK